MIIATIQGGLGNQLFCYAAARAAAHRLGCVLRFDLCDYRDNKDREFALERYHIVGRESTDQEFRPYREMMRHTLKNRILNKVGYRRRCGKYRIFKQNGFGYDPDILSIRPHTLLRGAFQCERFFEDVSEIIRSEFIPKEEPDSVNREISHRICDSNSVCIHVRRTDYITDARYANIIRPCSIAYYMQALDRMNDSIEDPTYFVFSDEPDWCRANLDFNRKVYYIDANGPGEPWKDLHLISQCRHHIIANSTFSWWGAWLAQHAEQKVIAPGVWLIAKDLDSSQVVPPRWMRI
jgi:hypothetical protein